MLFCAAIARRRMGDPCRQFLITTQHLIVLYELMHDTPFVEPGTKAWTCAPFRALLIRVGSSGRTCYLAMNFDL